MQGGTLSGDGALIVAETAEALFGREHDADRVGSTVGNRIARDVEIAGRATLSETRLDLGVDSAGLGGVTLAVTPTGVLRFDGPLVSIADPASTAAAPNRVANAGLIEKTGGGVANIDAATEFTAGGAVSAVDGALVTAAGTFGAATPPRVPAPYPDDIASGQTRSLSSGDNVGEISVSGGVLTIADNVTVDNPALLNGRIEGPGRLTVTGLFDWAGGDILAAGGVVLADAARMVMGEEQNPEAPRDRGRLAFSRRCRWRAMRCSNRRTSAWASAAISAAHWWSATRVSSRSAVHARRYRVRACRPID